MTWVHLLSPKIRILLNAPKAEETSPSKIAGFLLLGVAVWVGLYFGAEWFLAKCLAVEPIGELLVDKLIDMALLVIFSILVFSNVITAFSTFYLADDLRLLMTKPLPRDGLYTARLIETCAISGWMPLLFGLPIFVAAGVLFGAGVSYYLILAAVLVGMTIIPAAIAVLLTLLFTNILPAQRTREVFLFLGVLLCVGVFILIRALNPEQLFNPDQFANTMELFASLQAPRSQWLPSTWAWNLLSPALRGDEIPWVHMAGLYATAAAFFFSGAWAFRRWHFSGYSKSLEGRHAGSGIERAVGFLRRRSVSGPELARRSLARLSAGRGSLDILREMVAKDRRVFIRDTSQWSQIILLLALVVIYLLNFRYFRTMGEGGIIGPLGLYMLNIGLCGFVVSAMAVRFLFPAVSLEGRSFWLIKAAPITMKRFLAAKWLGGGMPLIVVAELLTLGSNWMLGSPLSLTVAGAVVMLSLSLGLSGLAVGLGAIYPRFNVNNAAKVAAGFGGVLYMFLGLALLVGVIALSFGPSWALLHLAQGGHTGMGQDGQIAAIACTAALVVIPPAVGICTVLLGARALERR